MFVDIFEAHRDRVFILCLDPECQLFKEEVCESEFHLECGLVFFQFLVCSRTDH